MSGNQILQSLVNSKAIGDDFQQSFADPRGHQDASTTYWQGDNQSIGRWKVVNDQYCSQWPPNPHWSCYDMKQGKKDGHDIVIWIAKGQRFEAKIEPK